MKSNMLIILTTALINAFLIHTIENSDSSDSGLFIYGKVTTIDNESYEGQIRWGKEEAFWFDMFNSTKVKNENLKYLSDDDLDMLEVSDTKENKSFFGNWFNSNEWYSYNNDDHIHAFACRFGDIKSLDIGGDDDVTLELKNGHTIDLEGGSNDIGADIKIHDHEFGTLTLDWQRIDRVDFMETPKDFVTAFGKPLYGKVKTELGDFEGFLQWDHDERLSNDELNGDTEDGSLNIHFGHIKMIKKSNHGSIVTLKSGRSLKLSGTNDVNDENRGIIVNIPDMGRVDIMWDEFEEIEFTASSKLQGLEYDDFKGETRIEGTVTTTDGKRVRGPICFDLDEKYQLELLDGMYKEITYQLPFEKIKSIKPLNREESEIKLENGKRIILEGKVDVNENNDGILVFTDIQNPQYIPWAEISIINFK